MTRRLCQTICATKLAEVYPKYIQTLEEFTDAVIEKICYPYPFIFRFGYGLLVSRCVEIIIIAKIRTSPKWSASVSVNNTRSLCVQLLQFALITWGML